MKQIKIGADVVQDAPEIYKKVAEEFPLVTFSTGKIILDNETGFFFQKKLQKMGITMVILPVKVTEDRLNHPLDLL